ncbi:MAG TPA: thioredoxin family protein [Microbacterium sp.]|uniref:TlpA family protein disulfide reductase n=1 Tax=Microbacterium sp. TaxID=51671 RepID=UPI002D0324F2|nr:thioredoxin family protein [Microbacterium sp.]HWI30661.1 thioredoxin family protein [Microbacterium sp.]
MTLINAVLALTALLAVTVGVGLLLKWRQGRPRHTVLHEVVEPTRLGAESLGERATLLQFSTEVCARCPAVHRTLSEIADTHEGVTHLDIDVTHRPDIAKHFHVLQTPTTLILDSNGIVQTRFGGAARRDVVELELTRVAGEVEPTSV